MKILTDQSPKQLFEYFVKSTILNRLIQPKFKLTSFRDRSFSHHGSKILNYLLKHDIIYTEVSKIVFTARLKRHLLFTQSQSIAGDDAWLPCNHDIFSDIKLSN